jgi:hypothetical protein
LRRRWLLLAGGLALAAAATTAWLLTSDEAAQTTLRVEYRVVEPGGLAHTETLEVDRPYRARTQVFAGDRPTGGFVWTESAVFTIKAAEVQRSQDVPPSQPGPDSGLDVALPLALQQGLVRLEGPASYAGRTCTWWLSRHPLESGAFELPTDADRVRTCVTGDGLVLAQLWRIAGKDVVSREAVSVEQARSLTDEELFGGEAPGGGLGLLRVRALDEPADPPLAMIAKAPAGFAFDRGAVTAQLDGPDGQASAVSDVAVYLRGGRLAVLQETQPQGRPAQLPDRGESVDLGALGTGRLEPWYGGLRLSWVMPRSVLVTLAGPLTRDEVLRWARSLQPR